MCYLRNFAPIQKTFSAKHQTLFDQASDISNQHDHSKSTCFDFEFLNNSNPICFNNNSSQMLMNLLKIAQMNSKALQNISNKINQNDILLDDFQCQDDSASLSKEIIKNQSDTDLSQEPQGKSFQAQQFLTKKLFGENKQYKYKLQLDGEFPEQVFKQRNFSFNLKLIDYEGNTIRNSNIIHLCLGVCDVNGQWVTQTKAKEPLMKGKTQSQLYHGAASYTKIFSRDVSRHYPEGKLNLIIYPKQSVLKYCNGFNFLEQTVNSEEIEPLVIKDLTIKAKKKQ